MQLLDYSMHTSAFMVCSNINMDSNHFYYICSFVPYTLLIQRTWPLVVDIRCYLIEFLYFQGKQIEMQMFDIVLLFTDMLRVWAGPSVVPNLPGYHKYKDQTLLKGNSYAV